MLTKQELISIINKQFIQYFEFFSEDDFLNQTEFDDCIDDFTSKIENYFRNIKILFSSGGGADKNVIIFEDYDFVLKIPKVSGSREIEVFQAAKAAGWEKYFVPVKYINSFDFGDRTAIIYTQKKVSFFKDNDWHFEDEIDSQSEELSETYDKIFPNYRIIRKDGGFSYIVRSKKLVAFFLYRENKVLLKDFLDFLMEERVNDLHSSNFYISQNSGLQIFDYSGYDDSDLYPDDEEYYSY